MPRDTSQFAMSNKVRLLLTKKELEIARGCSAANIKRHSPHRLKQYIKLVSKLRDKYRDLTQRQKVVTKHFERNSQGFRTIEKAKIFNALLLAFKDQSKKVKVPAAIKKNQKQLDHDEHYDLDGVTQVKGKVKIPTSNEVSYAVQRK